MRKNYIYKQIKIIIFKFIIILIIFIIIIILSLIKFALYIKVIT